MAETTTLEGFDCLADTDLFDVDGGCCLLTYLIALCWTPCKVTKCYTPPTCYTPPACTPKNPCVNQGYCPP
ncbi:MAG: hypothetical protein FWF75_01135 [Propionibacteriaceae bacterium]|nr:hypothetical protein [Propionibacteriaceae bacterium]